MKVLHLVRLFKVAVVAVCVGGFVFFVGCKKDEPDNQPVEVPTIPQDTTVGKDTLPELPDVPKLENINKTALLQLVNNYRTSGCNCTDSEYFAPTTPVRWSDTLSWAADDHSLDMYTNNFFSHTGSDSSNAGVRIKRRDYNWRTCGENIAKGYPTEEAVVQGWIKSPGHCKNIMNPNFKEMGVARRGSYWTQVFGTRY